MEGSFKDNSVICWRKRFLRYGRNDDFISSTNSQYVSKYRGISNSSSRLKQSAMGGSFKDNSVICWRKRFLHYGRNDDFISSTISQSVSTYRGISNSSSRLKQSAMEGSFKDNSVICWRKRFLRYGRDDDHLAFRMTTIISYFPPTFTTTPIVKIEFPADMYFLLFKPILLLVVY